MTTTITVRCAGCRTIREHITVDVGEQRTVTQEYDKCSCGEKRVRTTVVVHR